MQSDENYSQTGLKCISLPVQITTSSGDSVVNLEKVSLSILLMKYTIKVSLIKTKCVYISYLVVIYLKVKMVLFVLNRFIVQ
jgi:hypothetical protein